MPKEAQEEYDGIICQFYSFFDYGDETQNSVEEEIIRLMDSEQHRDAFAAFLAGYKYAREQFAGAGIEGD